MWYVYIIRIESGPLYTGITTDPDRRLNEHQAGTGAKYLRGKGPLKRVYCSEIGSRSLATKVEIAIKKLSKKAKEQLISGERSLTPIIAELTT